VSTRKVLLLVSSPSQLHVAAQASRQPSARISRASHQPTVKRSYVASRQTPGRSLPLQPHAHSRVVALAAQAGKGAEEYCSQQLHGAKGGTPLEVTCASRRYNTLASTQPRRAAPRHTAPRRTSELADVGQQGVTEAHLPRQQVETRVGRHHIVGDDLAGGGRGVAAVPAAASYAGAAVSLAWPPLYCTPVLLPSVTPGSSQGAKAVRAVWAQQTVRASCCVHMNGHQ
jgi:hypothetical protein